jgi:hypothetical protein
VPSPCSLCAGLPQAEEFKAAGKQYPCFSRNSLEAKTGPYFRRGDGNCKRTTVLTCGKDGECKSDDKKPCGLDLKSTCFCADPGAIKPNKCECLAPVGDAESLWECSSIEVA